MSPPIHRPRLLPHVLARRHVTGSTRLVVLHDSDTTKNHRVGERTWLVLSAMDGTRDVEGIVAFASAGGSHAGAEEVTDLVRDLAAEGMIADGVAAPPVIGPASEGGPAPEVRAPSSPPDRPIVRMPDFTLSCDGSGTCCRFYPSIAFSPLDAARARVALPEVFSAGVNEERVFLPLLGSERRGLSVALVDGRCAYLEADLGCGIHRTAGVDAKPLGCRTYPARFMDDGRAVRVVAWPECGCVFKSGRGAMNTDGDPLASGAETRGALDPACHIERLPHEVVLAPGRTATRDEIVAWTNGIWDARSSDAVGSFAALAAVVEASGLDIAASRAAIDNPPRPDAARFAPSLEALGARIGRLASEDWRGAKDMVRITATAVDQAVAVAASATEELLEGPGTLANSETFYLRLILFGYHAIPKSAQRSLSTLLFDRAVRALVARALKVVSTLAALEDPAFDEPLALVEATMRGYGVRGYLGDIPGDPQ